MSFKIFIFFVIIMSKSCVSQDYASIDDIPIESYDHGDHQENHMDLELLPRHGRSFSIDDDPKDLFFRSMRSFDEVDDVRNFGPYQYLPRASFQMSNQKDESRNKRSAAEASNIEEKTLSGIVEHLGKPLEVIPWDARNLTESEDKSETRMAFEDPKGDGDLLINDFIRFRRSANKNENEKDIESNSNGPQLDPFSQKLIMEPLNGDLNRETRGAIKEHWIKQLYPVRRSDDVFYEDNVPSSSEAVKAPRVHFVGKEQSKGESTPNEFRSYEREGRSRNLEREPPREVNRGMTGELERNIPFYDRRFRPHGPPMERERPYYRDELYPRYDYRDPRNSMYFSRYENYDRTRNEHSLSPHKPQKRIIYYATLPEVSRNFPNLDSRDRYRYQPDRFDDRYLNDPYRFRQTYPKPRYEDEGKTPYPVKVLTDVNVREVKKNPERRIYSEVDRSRYAYNTPAYRAVDG